GKACKVFAFEPNPFTFASLSKNIILNGCAADVTALNMALSDETRVAQFRYSTLRSGAASHAVIKESGDARIDGAHQRILCMRLDDAAKRFALPPPSHMKIDVDGAELDVLDGSARTLARPELSSILIEIDENKDSHARVLALLENQGFVLLYKYAVHRPTSKIFNCVFERQTASR
ncbi:MAG: FkbM family methyltransferase, partial [Candidatus Sungbacteria bacterium]|nr:FkbM family methyltransferase [Candidatus Sungbacteria bacterium]